MIDEMKLANKSDEGVLRTGCVILKSDGESVCIKKTFDGKTARGH